MNRDAVLKALNNNEFDGVNHSYQPVDGYGKHETYQTKMKVLGSEIEITTIYRNKFFDGKENEWETDEKVEILTGSDAIDFIERRPYYFSQVRPDLF